MQHYYHLTGCSFSIQTPTLAARGGPRVHTGEFVSSSSLPRQPRWALGGFVGGLRVAGEVVGWGKEGGGKVG